MGKIGIELSSDTTEFMLLIIHILREAQAEPREMVMHPSHGGETVKEKYVVTMTNAIREIKQVED